MSFTRLQISSAYAVEGEQQKVVFQERDKPDLTSSLLILYRVSRENDNNNTLSNSCQLLLLAAAEYEDNYSPAYITSYVL